MDMTMRLELLPAPLIIKGFVHGESDCDYEKYLMELINSSNLFFKKGPGGFHKPIAESNGECDAISDNYQLDFKLLASKTSLQSRSILSHQMVKISETSTAMGSSKCPRGRMQSTRIYAALRRCSLSDLIEIKKRRPKKQGVENDICNILELLEVEKNLLLFFPYKFTFDTPHTFHEEIKSSVEALNNDFKASFVYRKSCVPNLDTFFVYICNGLFIICQVDNHILYYVESIPEAKIPTYIKILNLYSR